MGYMPLKLTQAISSIPLKHSKWCGRIAWDARQDPIQFTVEIARKKKAMPRKIYVPIMIGDEGEIVGSIDLGSFAPLVIANLNFERNFDDFDLNFYHPEFPEVVQAFVSELLKGDKALKKKLEAALTY